MLTRSIKDESKQIRNDIEPGQNKFDLCYSSLKFHGSGNFQEYEQIRDIDTRSSMVI